MIKCPICETKYSGEPIVSKEKFLTELRIMQYLICTECGYVMKFHNNQFKKYRKKTKIQDR